MIKGPKGGQDIFKKRRKSLVEQTCDGVVILFSHPEQIRNHDVHHPYRQDSSFYYVTGFTEPESVVVLNGSSFTMFVREKDPARELWDGFRYGTKGAEQYFAPDKVYPIAEIHSVLPELIGAAEKVYYKLEENKENDKMVMEAVEKARRRQGRSGLGMPTFVDAKQMIGELRLFKGPDEIENLRKACEISAHGHIAAMKICKPGIFEYEIEAEIEREFRRRGSQRVGYGSIVGSGPNATVLHYVFNDDECKKDHLLLVDAGAEYGYLTGDITRTFPVSGKFSAAQAKIYSTVLKVQKDCIKFVKPGVKFADVHLRAIDGLVEGMLELGLLRGNKKDIIEKKDYLKYYPHGTGHWLGMDVHDSGLYNKNGEARKLESGMCFTVEPGLYVPQDDSGAPAEFRGIGIRIEDDVVVTASGCDVMTSIAPKEIAEIETVVGQSKG